MASTPVVRRLCRKIALSGGDEVVFDRIRGGETIAEIARDYGVKRTTMYTWRKRGGEERRRGWEEAKREAAEARVDRADEALMDVEDLSTVTPAEVKLRDARAKHHRWVAGRWDPERYGDAAARLNVGIDLGGLAVEALRELGSMERARERQARPELLEAEVVDDEG